jgi:photosystem II stability/assembly factor-like uncharacterized protein
MPTKVGTQSSLPIRHAAVCLDPGLRRDDGVFLLTRHLMKHLVCSGVFRRRNNESRSILFCDALSEWTAAVRLEVDGDRKKAFSRGHKADRRTTRTGGDMTSVRLLVGTRKGAFVLTADGARKNWDVSGPHFAGWEIYHLKGSPADPNRIYASQSSGWFGQQIQRSDDGGKTWEAVDNSFAYDGVPGTHQWYDGTPHPWEFKRVWHIEPSLADPDTVYAGVEDAALFQSKDGGKSWAELSGLRSHGSGPHWQPGAGGMCLHTILLDPKDPQRMFIAISAAGAFRTDDGGATWRPINRGLKSEFMPDPTAEVGHCVHRLAMHPTRPEVLYMQKHWDVMRSDDAGNSWREVSGNLPTDFGFVIDVHAHEPETIYVVPIKSDAEHFPIDGQLQVWRSRTGGNDWEALTNGLPQSNCYVNVLRDAMCVDTLDSCGVYFGTTGGQVYGSADAGDTWSTIVRDLPAVLSVEVQTLT